jgi:hypothetical protein
LTLKGRLRSYERPTRTSLVDVFDGKGDTVQRPAVVATADLGFGFFGRSQRFSSEDGVVGMQCSIERSNTIQRGLRELNWDSSFSLSALQLLRAMHIRVVSLC